MELVGKKHDYLFSNKRRGKATGSSLKLFELPFWCDYQIVKGIAFVVKVKKSPLGLVNFLYHDSYCGGANRKIHNILNLLLYT